MKHKDIASTSEFASTILKRMNLWYAGGAELCPPYAVYVRVSGDGISIRICLYDEREELQKYKCVSILVPDEVSVVRGGGRLKGLAGGCCV